MIFLVVGNPFPDHFVAITEDLLQENHLKKNDTVVVSREEVEATYQNITGKQIGEDFTLGGSGANVAKVLASLFDDSESSTIYLLGRVGNDLIGQTIATKIQELGIHFHMRLSPAATGVVSCYVTSDASRTMQSFLGAATEFNLEDFIAEDLSCMDHVHIEGYNILYGDQTSGYTFERIIAQAKKQNPFVKISIDLAAPGLVAGNWGRFSKIVQQVDFVFGNLAEFTALNKGKQLTPIFYRSFLLNQIVVVTDGAKGCYVKDKGSEVAKHYKAFNVTQVVDTTGAGDYFDGGYLYGHYRGMSVEKCVETGSWAAATIITKLGADLTNKEWDSLKSPLRL